MIEAPPARDTGLCKELVERIVASSYLSKSTRLTDMFVYLCSEVLDEGVRDIHELELGHRVFGRPVRYDTTADNIVRVHASMLRKRLSEYFATEGRDEEFVVEIPRGNYAPIFRRRESGDQGSHSLGAEAVQLRSLEPVLLKVIPETQRDLAAAPDLGKDSAPAQRRSPWRRWIFPGLAIFFAVLSAVLYVRLQRATMLAQATDLAAVPVVRQFWSQVFHSDQNVDIVLDDASLEYYQEATGQPVALAQYFDRSYLQSVNPTASRLDPALINALVLRRQSNFADVAMVWELAGIADALRGHGRVEFARDMSYRDAKSSNLILLGNPESDPWIQPFENDLSLQWKFDSASRTFYPVDKTMPTQQDRFRPAVVNGKSREVYASISFLPNLSNTGDVLIISGTGGAAMDAARNWLLSEASMQLVRSRLLQTRSGPFPHFEMLLKVEKGADVPRDVSIVICRPLKGLKPEAPRPASGL